MSTVSTDPFTARRAPADHLAPARLYAANPDHWPRRFPARWTRAATGKTSYLRRGHALPSASRGKKIHHPYSQARTSLPAWLLMAGIHAQSRAS